MRITIQSKTDYSYLFSNLSSSTSSSSGIFSGSFLSDYASIKNGSYAKLMKAYYAETGSSDSVSSLVKKTTGTTSDDAKSIAKVQTTTDALKDSADELLESKAETTEELYDGVSKFVSTYNAVIEAVDDVSNSSVVSRTTNMSNSTTASIKSLNAIGITMEEDGTLSLDKETFLKADVSSVKSLFTSNGSYGYRTSAYASLINYAADSAANATNTYTVSGTYSNYFSSGNLYSSYF